MKIDTLSLESFFLGGIVWWNLFFTGAAPHLEKNSWIRACVHNINFGVTQHSGSGNFSTGVGTPQYLKKINPRYCFTSIKKGKQAKGAFLIYKKS